MFKHSLGQMLLLAGPGVLLSTGMVAAFAVYVMNYDWNWATGLTFGAMLSATDPVAVVALLKVRARAGRAAPTHAKPMTVAAARHRSWARPSSWAR